MTEKYQPRSEKHHFLSLLFLDGSEDGEGVVSLLLIVLK
jgi:hypothetical protein